MLTYDLDRRGKLARYDYLYRCIREDILAGRLTAGEKLPSKRSLASHLQTAVITVQNAYAQLEAEGYLYTREKRGYYVADVERHPAAPGRAPARSAPQPQRSWLLDLSSGGSGTEDFPFSVWAKLMRRVLSEEGAALLRPTDSLFRQYPAYRLRTQNQEERCRNGNPFYIKEELAEGIYRIYGADGAFLCLSRLQEGTMTSLKNFFGA